MQKTAHASHLSAVHYAHISALPAAEKAALILSMSPAELTAYAHYLDATAYDYADDVPPDYEPPTAASLYAEAAAVLDAAEYAAFSDAVDDSAPDPLPADLGEDDDEDPDPEPPAAAAPKPRRQFSPASHVYLLHFSSPVAHAQHYLGSAADVESRLKEHRAGQGARLTQVAVQRGADLLLVRTWRGGRRKERAIKEAYKHAFTRLCPLCSAGAGSQPKHASVTKYAA